MSAYNLFLERQHICLAYNRTTIWHCWWHEELRVAPYALYVGSARETAIVLN